MDTNFYAHIARTLAARPDHPLLTWPAVSAADAGTNEHLPPASNTGAEVTAGVAAVRQRLTVARVQPGQRVLLLVPVSAELVGALLGVLAHGAVVVLPPAGATPRQLLRLARQGGAAILPQQPGWALRLLARCLGVRLLGADALGLRTDAPNLPPHPVPPTQAALISHTSGSTGQPKQIVRSHAVLSAQHAVLKELFPPWPGQRDFPLFPNVLLHNLATGAATVLPQVPWTQLADFHPALIIDQLLEESVDSLTGNVFYFEKLLPELRKQPGGFPAVRALGVGGSPVPEWLGPALREVFPNAKLYVIYGSSEAEPMAVRELTGPSENPALGYAVGQPLPSLELRLDPLGELHLPDGRRATVGEIQVRGPHVAVAADGWLRTGDYGYLAANGQLYLTGREGNEALRLSLQHYQLEHVLQHLPGVERVAARPVPTGFDVYVQGQVSEAAVREVLALHFPAEACADVHFRPELPVDKRHFSKIRYGQL